MVDTICNYLPKYDAMVKGHMNQISQHIRSPQSIEDFPESEPDMVEEDNFCYVYEEVAETGQIYTDLTCRSPNMSLSGNKHILVLNNYENNTINTTPEKNIPEREMTRAYDLLIQVLLGRGFIPSMESLGNEASRALTS
jgi:hypothetical protein